MKKEQKKMPTRPQKPSNEYNNNQNYMSENRSPIVFAVIIGLLIILIIAFFLQNNNNSNNDELGEQEEVVAEESNQVENEAFKILVDLETGINDLNNIEEVDAALEDLYKLADDANSDQEFKEYYNKV